MTENTGLLSRRQFIKIVAASGLTVGLGAALARRLIESSEWTPVEETRGAIGTYIRLVLLTPDRDSAQQAIEATFDRIAQLEMILSRYRADSALGRLNAAGALEHPPYELIDVLQKSRQIFEWTSGAFDVTIGAVANLIEQCNRRGEVPSSEEVRTALKRVGFDKLSIGSDRITFDQAGMFITLDGIAKGYIVDAAIAELEQRDFTQVMVDAGGDIGGSRRGDGSSWHIAIQDPRGSTGKSIAVTQLPNGALATSGDYRHAYTPDFQLNHILDPRTGFSPLELSSVSVSAPTACVADALATGIMVLGSQAGLALAERLSNVECLLVTKADKVIRSAGFSIET